MKHRDTKTGKKLTDSVMCGCSNSNILRIWVLEAEKSEVGTLKQNFLKKQEKRHITQRLNYSLLSRNTSNIKVKMV